MRRIAVLVVLSFFLFGCSKRKPAFTEEFSIIASETGYEYQISVFEKGEGDTYKVFYVLDAKPFSKLINQGYNKGLIEDGKKAIFICIGYTKGNERERDYSPIEQEENTGEAPEFFRFIQNDLKPHIADLGIDTSRAVSGLIGHSLGGLAVCYALVEQNMLFSNYVMLSPALWWEDYYMFEQEDLFRESNQLMNANLFMGIGKDEDFGMNLAYETFYQIMDENYPYVELAEKNYENASHMGSRLNNVSKGINFILER